MCQGEGKVRILVHAKLNSRLMFLVAAEVLSRPGIGCVFLCILHYVF